MVMFALGAQHGSGRSKVQEPISGAAGATFGVVGCPLDKHPRAQPATAERVVRAQIAPLKIHAWLQVETEARVLKKA
ncbi:MAG: hypothetical protein DMG57_19270 [Acidobacteria bacterium]|nr:MAG: hypothetical protein DMG57_19270 [Acidobacteriota bacterium]